MAQLRIGSTREASLRDQAGYAARDQLVDYVISIPEYSQSLTADWVARNGRGWGGLRNRWATSKGHFLGALSSPRDSATHARLIVEIVESAQQDQWSEIVRAAGGEAVVRRAVQPALYGNEYYERIRAVQQRVTGARLIEAQPT